MRVELPCLELRVQNTSQRFTRLLAVIYQKESCNGPLFLFWGRVVFFGFSQARQALVLKNDGFQHLTCSHLFQLAPWCHLLRELSPYRSISVQPVSLSLPAFSFFALGIFCVPYAFIAYLLPPESQLLEDADWVLFTPVGTIHITGTQQVTHYPMTKCRTPSGE